MDKAIVCFAVIAAVAAIALGIWADLPVWEIIVAFFFIYFIGGYWIRFFMLMALPGLYKSYLKTLLNRFLVLSPAFVPAFFGVMDEDDLTWPYICIISGIIIVMTTTMWAGNREPDNPYEPGKYETVACSPLNSFIVFTICALGTICALS